MNTEPTQAVWIPGTVVFGPVLPPGHPDLETSGEGGESKQGGLADAPPPPPLRTTFASEAPPADHAPCCSCSLCTTPTIAALNAHQTLAETRGGGANATWGAELSRAGDRTVSSSSTTTFPPLPPGRTQASLLREREQVAILHRNFPMSSASLSSAAAAATPLALASDAVRAELRALGAHALAATPVIGALTKCCIAPAACGESCRSRASDRTASSSPDIGTLTALDDDTCGCILAFLLPALHVSHSTPRGHSASTRCSSCRSAPCRCRRDEIETMRAACRGGRALVGRTLLPQSAHERGIRRAFPRLFAAGRPPLTVAESLALYRGLRQKAIMVALVTELQVEGPGWGHRPGLAVLKDWNGVTLDEDLGRVEAIDFSERCAGGNMRRLVLPDGIKNLDLHGCPTLKGPIHKLALPEGMQDLNLSYCPKVSGEL